MPRLQISRVQDAIGIMTRDSRERLRLAPPAACLVERTSSLRELVCRDVGPETVKTCLTEIVASAVRLATQHCVSLQQAFADASVPADLGDLPVWGKHVGDVERAVEAVVRTADFYTSDDMPVDAPDITPLRALLPTLLLAAFSGFDSVDDFGRHVREHLRATVPAAAAGTPPFDPSTADAVTLFQPIQQKTFCPFAQAARLWGAPSYVTALSLEANVGAALPSLRSFVKVVTRDVLDGYLFAFPTAVAGDDLDAVRRFFKRFMDALRRLVSGAAEREAGWGEVLSSDWRFSVFGEQCFVGLFAPLYPPNHTRYTYEARDWVFVMLQPETAIHSLISDGGFDARVQSIRQRFHAALQDYPVAHLEANGYVMPLRAEDPPIRWYEPIG